MKSKSITSFLSGLCLLLATISIAGAGELPPPGSKPLSAILKSVEGLELGVITRSEFDDGWWEVKVCKGPACHKLYIDPRSGEEKRRREAHSDNELPPANGKPLLAIVQSIEDSKAGVITEVKFDDGFWEVDLRKDGQKIKLDINPGTGGTRR
jgi:hypothetical protein